MDPDCASHFEYRLWADAGNYSSLPRNYCEFCASQQELNNPSSNEGTIPFSSICNWILYIYNINWLMACTRVISHLPPASGAGGVSEARQGCRPKFGGAAPSQRGGASGRGATIHGGSEELMMD